MKSAIGLAKKKSTLRKIQLGGILQNTTIGDYKDTAKWTKASTKTVKSGIRRCYML